MDEGLGSQIATSAVPNTRSFVRVPSGTPGAGGEVTWDEMGQLGLHKALNEYYKLSASQRDMRLCSRGGAPTILCKVVNAVMCPQLPAALSPPALLAAGGALLYAAAWTLYSTAPLTIPLALWLACAPNGRLSLVPHAASALARLHPAAGEAVHVPLPAALLQPAAAAALLLVLLLLLRLSEAAVLSHRRQRWEAAQRRAAAADVQAAYAGWALPDGNAPATHATAGKAAAAARQGAQRTQQQAQQSAALLSVLQGEVQRLWHAVIGGQLHNDQLQSYNDVGAAVSRLSKETGVELRQLAGAGRGANGQASPIDPGRQLLDALLQIKHAVGVE